MLAFLGFKGTGCSHLLCRTVKEHVDNSNLFVTEMFGSKCEVLDVDSVNVNYLNQITGPRLAD